MFALQIMYPEPWLVVDLGVPQQVVNVVVYGMRNNMYSESTA